jgi:hypothetical protein
MILTYVLRINPSLYKNNLNTFAAIRPLLQSK